MRKKWRDLERCKYRGVVFNLKVKHRMKRGEGFEEEPIREMDAVLNVWLRELC